MRFLYSKEFWLLQSSHCCLCLLRNIPSGHLVKRLYQKDVWKKKCGTLKETKTEARLSLDESALKLLPYY